MSTYAYSVVAQQQASAWVWESFHNIGYVHASSEDEARGVAVREAHKKRPGVSIVSVAVIEILPESAE